MELWRRRDLEGTVKTEYVDGNFFTQDSAGNLVGVKCYKDGAEATLSGSVTGYCILTNGETVSVAGTRSGNQASILIPQSALAYPGPLGVVIKLVDGNTITTLISVIVVVYRSKTDTVITPSSQIITDWANQISAALQEVEDASAAQDAKIDDLKSAFEGSTGNGILNFIPGRYKTPSSPAAGLLVSYDDSTDYMCAIAPCVEGDIFTADVYGYTGTSRAWYFVKSDMTIVSSTSYAGANAHLQGTITAPANAAYVCFTNRLASQANGYYAFKGDSLKSIVDGIISNKIGFVKQLNNTDDLDNVKTPGWYRWIGSSLPENKPSNFASNMLVIGSYGFYTQIVHNNQNATFVRCYSSSNWTVWMRFANDAEIKSITETITGVVSIATITGDVDDQYALNGITFTKKADNEFTLTGKSTAVTGKAFNVLLGSEETATSKSAVLSKNIVTPGIYTLAFKTSGANINEETLFALTDGTFGNRRYIKSGESFTVEDDSVCLFVYGTTRLDLTGKTLTVKWALYEGEEYMGFPYVENDQPIAVDPIARNLGLRKQEQEKQNEIVSWGKSNTMANAKQIMEIEWQPTAATMPRGSSAYFDMNTKYKGMPYSSVRDNDKAVGTNVSLHTFMTAVNDPNSVLYTRRSTTSNAQCYYGTVCSGLCNHAYALGLHLTNYFLGTSDWFETIPMQSIQRGDMIYKPGHVAMIYDVGKDEWGRIENVTVMEEWAPNSRVKYYSSYQSFLSGRDGYIARRYKFLDGVTYKQIPYVRCFNEDQQDIIYPDVQTDHGDQAVFGYCAGAGQNFTDYANISGITINVINARDFSSIVVTREGAETPVYSTGNIQSFTIPGADILPGLYTITATGTEYTSVSTFFVADVSGTWNKDTGVITFSSTNATPVLVDVYAMPIEDGKYAISCSSHVITDDERTAGSANVLDLVDTTHQQAKVTFDTPYGQAIWRSEAHPTWTAIT